MSSKRDFIREGEQENDEWELDRFRTKKCTPEILLSFINKLGHYPTMLELKGEFGVILGPILCGHELQKCGKWPQFKRR